MSIEVGSKLEGKVTGITNFGAFVELPNGSTGLSILVKWLIIMSRTSMII